MSRRYDLEDRLIQFASTCIRIAERLPLSKAGLVLEGQLVRSATSAALNYGEAQAAESKQDFIHKMKISLKEIRESRVAIKIIADKPLLQEECLAAALDEANQLMAIFIACIKTAADHRSKSP